MSCDFAVRKETHFDEVCGYVPWCFGLVSERDRAEGMYCRHPKRTQSMPTDGTSESPPPSNSFHGV